jgi:anti-sigma factor RsiW
MRCEDVKELLEVYVEGELSQPEQKEVEAHISSCESCKQELVLTRSIPILVGSLATPPVPEDIIPNTLKRIREVPMPRRSWVPAFGASISRKWQLAAVASLVLAVTLFGIGYQRMDREPGITEAEVASAAEEIKLALGIVGAAAQDVQLAALTEGARVLCITKSKSKDAVQTLSKTQSEVFDKLQRSLPASIQLQFKEVKGS